MSKAKPISGIREKIHEIIFEADTPMGKLFDVVLLVMIVLSVMVVILESVKSIDEQYHQLFFYVEWTLTILFSIEYLLRIYVVIKPWKYIGSFFGIVDLMAILPTYLSLILPGSHYLLTIRALRLLRVFRIFKVARYFEASKVITDAMKASRAKITVFLFAIVLIVVIIGSAMYLIEGEVNQGFSSIPHSMYWAIVTLTTVGFGDVIPITTLGRFLSAILMILGYAIIAVPTGIVTAEFAAAASKTNSNFLNSIACPSCSEEGHERDALYCKYCGAKL